MTSKRPDRRPERLAAAALAAAVGLTGLTQDAAAQQSARVESTVNPHFGWLLNPPIPPRVRRPWGGHHHHPGTETAVMVDCDKPGADVQAALNRLRAGGTLVLRARGGGTCTGSLTVNYPVTIIGEGAWRWNSLEPTGPGPQAILRAAPGQPCLTIKATAGDVRIRDMVIDMPSGGRRACVEAWGTYVDLNDTVIRYVGDGAAVEIQDGSLKMNRVRIASRSQEAAVVTIDSSADLTEVDIAATRVGLDLGAGRKSNRLRGVGVTGVSDGRDASYGSPVAGVYIRSPLGGAPETTLSGVYVEDFRAGLWFEAGVNVRSEDGYVIGSDIGVVVEGGDVKLLGLLVSAREMGVYARAGRTSVRYASIFNVSSAAINADRGALVQADSNYVFPWARRGCGFMYQSAYQRRGQKCMPYVEEVLDFHVATPWAGVDPYLFGRADMKIGEWKTGWSEWIEFNPDAAPGENNVTDSKRRRLRSAARKEASPDPNFHQDFGWVRDQYGAPVLP